MFPSLGSILSQLNPLYTLKNSFCNTHSDFILLFSFAFHFP